MERQNQNHQSKPGHLPPPPIFSAAGPGGPTSFRNGPNIISNWPACADNCSFVSGETSSAVWLAAPALLVPLPWRYAAFAGVAVYTTGIAAMRLLLGGHFLSDVLFAAIFTGLVIWTVHGRTLRWRMPPTDATIDAAFERVCNALRRAGAVVTTSW